ncbi:FG-GAP-like repeat-containing protein [Bacteroidota bacterium]
MMTRSYFFVILAGIFISFNGNAQLLREPIESVEPSVSDSTYKLHLPDYLKRSYTPREDNESIPMARIASDPHARTGTDGAEYEFIDSNEPNGPVFSWIDITGSGMAIVMGDDEAETMLMQFDFPFYGNTYDYVTVNSNGFLTFEIDEGTIFNYQIPYPSDINNLIVPFGDDLYPRQGGTVHYFSEPTKFTVQYTNVPYYDTLATNTFQVVLYDDGQILFQYLDMNDLGNSSIGIENHDGTLGVQVSYREFYVENNLAVLFTQFLGPSDLRTVAVGPNQIDLTWTDNSTTEDNFVLERSVNDTSNFSVLQTLSADITTYSDISVTELNTYFYRVKATSVVPEESSYSNIAIGYSGPDTRIADSLSLVSFYYATDGPGWTNNSGWLVSSLELWFGVTLFNGRVTDINLSFNNLSGVFPVSVLDLDSLQQLILNYNMLTGNIPANIDDLTALRSLQLANNQFSGSIPVTIGNLSNLLDLILDYNQFSGSLPVEIGNLSNLQQLSMIGNQLSGNIPIEITNLTQLTNLNLSMNQLTGTIPLTINSLSTLFTLDLSYNQLSGTIPAEIGTITSLVNLSLSENEFAGYLDASILALPGLINAGVSGNLLDSIPDITGVSYSLYLSANNLDFDDLEPNAGTIAIITDQNQFGVAVDSVVSEGSSVSFTVNPGGTDNSYTWFGPNGVLPDDTLATLTLSSITKNMAGEYYCRVLNNILGFELESQVFNLAVNELTSFSSSGTGSIITNTNASFRSAWADYDNDGFLDLFVPNNGNNSLYHNSGDGTFTEITVGEIVNDGGTSYAAAWADYDNDGYVDLFVANFSGENNFLYQNNGDGTFTKIISGPVVTDGGFSTSGAWGDYNKDGYIDLFVANGGYNAPENNFLYENNGDGTFTKITTGSFVTDDGRSTHAVWANFYRTDYFDDNLPDLYVTNEGAGAGQNNFMYVNMGNGVFIKDTKSPAVLDNADSYYALIGNFSQGETMDILVCNGLGVNNMLFKDISFEGLTEFIQITDLDLVTDGGNSYAATFGV